jgi:hypothetical protein
VILITTLREGPNPACSANDRFRFALLAVLKAIILIAIEV